MRTNYLTSLSSKRNIGAFIICLLLSVPVTAQILSYTFNSTGAMQGFTVPVCVTMIDVDIRGGAGANALDKLPSNSVGGAGGRVQGTMTVTPGQVLNLFVGQAGTNSGATAYNGGGGGGSSTAGSGACTGGFAGGGGGASDIRVGGVALTDRIAVAGGGGGAGRDYCNGSCIPCGCGASGGPGGGLTGVAGSPAMNCGFGYPGTGVNGGYPGTPTAGGAGGLGDGGGTPGTAGALGVGGAGAGNGTYDVSGGGAGGGYYGGGGGGGASTGSGVGGGGGGGGSSYVGTLMNAVTTPSYNATGDGMIILSYNFGVPSITITGNNGYICAGSTVTLTASGSANYTWSTGSNNTSIVVNPTISTTYSVIGTTTAQCPPYGMIVTTVVALPVVTTTVSIADFTVCPGTMVTLNGGGTHMYTWTGGITDGVAFPAPNQTTTYTVTGTSTITGCNNYSTAVVNIYPSSFSLSSNTTICSGKSTSLVATGGITYLWSNGSPFQGVSVSPTVNTVYTVTVTTPEFCVVSNTVAVSVIPSPTVTATTPSTIICRQESAVLNASGATSYTWAGLSTGASVTVSPVAPLTSYTVTGSGSNGCTNSAVVNIALSFCTGVGELNETFSEALSIYPNPNKGEFSIRAHGAMDISLMNELGQVSRVIHLTAANNYKASVKDLPPGIYFAVSNSDNVKVNQKIVVSE